MDDQCFDAVADGNEIVKNGTNAVLVDTESKCVDTLSAINDRIDRIDIGVYGSIEKSDTDESETEIDAICYDTQPNDAPSSMSYYSNDHSQFETHKELLASQVVEPFTGTAPMSPSYLPMASQTAVEERRYLDMSVETTVSFFLICSLPNWRSREMTETFNDCNRCVVILTVYLSSVFEPVECT